MLARPAILLSALCLLVAEQSASSATWPQFRGPTGSGVSAETDLPTEWSTTAGVRWSIDLPGRANSSPAVTSQRVDLTTQMDDHSLWIISVDRWSGESVWSMMTSYAISGSPAVADGHLVTSFDYYSVAAFAGSAVGVAGPKALGDGSSARG